MKFCIYRRLQSFSRGFQFKLNGVFETSLACEESYDENFPDKQINVQPIDEVVYVTKSVGRFDRKKTNKLKVFKDAVYDI